MKKFRTPKKTLGTLDAEAAGALITAAADVALIIDRKGVVRDVAFGSDDLAADMRGDWLGKPWIDTVTVESRPKVESMLAEVAAKSEPRFRQVNYPSVRGGADVPIFHSTIALGDEGRVIAVGRDLRPMETLQQRLMDVEQSMEREFARLRHAETRYRLLFQIASEPVLILDVNQRVLEANPAATQLLGTSGKRLVGRPFPDGFDADGSRAIETMLAAVQTTGRSDGVRATLASSQREFTVSASLFRQDNSSHYLVKLNPADGKNVADGAPPLQSKLLEVLEGSPDGVVVTTPEGQILTANRAFLDLAQLATIEQARGQELDRWLGRQGADIRVLIGNVRQHGSVRLFATAMRGEYGAASDVEVSAVSALNGDQPCLGFTVRNVGKRAAGAETKKGRGELPRSMQELTGLIGRVPLKDLVRETTDVIERLSIEAALELTGDNRATAAEMLGLSRQSLYAKLRRYGLGDLDSADD